MADRTTDRGRDSYESGGRSARFREPRTKRGADAPTATGHGRRADFQPADDAAETTGILERFREEMLLESAVRNDETGEAADAFQAALLAEEVLGAHDKAARRIRGLSQLRAPTVADRRLYRRLLRTTDREDPVLGSLETSVGELEEPQASLLAAEGALEAWRRGAEPETVRTWLGRAQRPDPDTPLSWHRFRTALLDVDCLLEQGAREKAARRLEIGARAVRDGELAGILQRRAGLLAHVRGDVDGALDWLRTLATNEDLEHPLVDFQIFLEFECGDTSRVPALYDALAEHDGPEPLTELPRAFAGLSSGENRIDGALGRLRDASERRPTDDTLLRVRELLLDTESAREQVEADDELIDVLNARLEVTTEPEERVELLVRLGRLYERLDGLDEAAGEVYREALELVPDCARALRALGRLYAGRNNWGALADLYEHELEHLDFSGGRWRHHFRLAELYERKLEQPEEALHHYRATLEGRSHYLPALKGAARLLTTLERWAELTDLFLSTVEEVETRRQRLYLLDRAADVAERRLERSDVAIGAWEEILEIEENYPRAYAALGRLYAQTGRWRDLIDLNVREIEQVEDPEEAAALHLRNAEILERRLGDLEAAEESYRRALTLVPDFLPALEGLGQLYADHDRWEAIAQMTQRELRELEAGPEVLRQLEALAELVEQRLDRPGEAAALYARIEQLSGGGRVRGELARLRRREEDWNRLIGLLQSDAAERGADERAERLGQIGLLEEWFREDRERAFELYCAALDDAPDNRHWLEGIARTWSASETEPAEVASRLEDKVVEPLSPDLLDRYFQIIARLRERADGTSGTSRAYRLHGASESRENQAILQFEMAEAGERDELDEARRSHPACPREAAAHLDRSRPSDAGCDALDDAASEVRTPERRALVAELPPDVASDYVDDDDPSDLRLMRDLVRTRRGEELEELDDTAAREGFGMERLRAIHAEHGELFRTFKRWTYDELGGRRRRDVVVDRLVRLAELARAAEEPEQAADVHRQAATVVFPSVDEADELHPAIGLDELEGDVEERSIDRLYDSLRASEQWELFRRCLRAHVGRDGLEDAERISLFTELAAVCEDELGDLEGARDAAEHAWRLGERPELLAELVRLDRKADDLEAAVRHQRRHFRTVSELEEVEADRVLESGLRYAELLVETDDRGTAIEILEGLRGSITDMERRERLLRRLAHTYVDAGRPADAVEAFREFVSVEVRRDNLDDWRELVRLYDEALDDTNAAYELQWRIVKTFPSLDGELERLVQLAFRDGAIEECVQRLEARAEDVSSSDKRALLLERAARIAQEDLQEWEEADRLFEQVVETVEPGSDAELDALRRRVVCVARLKGREDEAVETFQSLLERDPFEPAALRAMLQLFERERAFDRVRLARQALESINCKVEREDVRTKSTPATPFGESGVEAYLLPDGFDGDVLQLLRKAMPLVRKIRGDQLLQKKVLDSRTLNADDVRDALDDAAAAFDLGRYTVGVGDNGPPEPQVFGSGSPEIWLNNDLVDGFGAGDALFTAGYVAALGWSGLGPALQLEGRELWHVIEGNWLRQRGEPFGEIAEPETERMSDAMSSPFLAVTRRRVASATESVVDRLAGIECERWPDAVEEFAARAGLVLSGDLAAAVRCLLRFRGWELALDDPETRDHIRRIDLIERLFRFAFSEQFLEARYELGLSGRPSAVDGPV